MIDIDWALFDDAVLSPPRYDYPWYTISWHYKRKDISPIERHFDIVPTRRKALGIHATMLDNFNICLLQAEMQMMRVIDASFSLLMTSRYCRRRRMHDWSIFWFSCQRVAFSSRATTTASRASPRRDKPMASASLQISLLTTPLHFCEYREFHFDD